MFRFDNGVRTLTFFVAPDGVLAQLVERLNGIEEVRGSNPLGSTLKKWSRSPTKGNTIGCTSRVRNPLGSIISRSEIFTSSRNDRNVRALGKIDNRFAFEQERFSR